MDERYIGLILLFSGSLHCLSSSLSCSLLTRHIPKEKSGAIFQLKKSANM